MEPVSRHFVIIDFGFPVALTDVMIPACSELSSLSIDVWLHKEQKDSKRLCVSTDINQNAILLNDLQPAPLCRYVKLIFVAHSTNIVKAKIPVGYYFGYPQVFFTGSESTTATTTSAAVPEVASVENSTTKTDRSGSKSTILFYLSYLEKLYEDNKCHYSISVGKLRELLNEIQFPSDNIGHLKMMQFNFSDTNESTAKIKEAYNECLDYQFQLNLNYQLIKRLRLSLWNEGEAS
jgi:baculoviral IAP repeat-containing protein 6